MGFSFDGSTKTITFTGGTTSVSVRDLWSRWVDWLAEEDNSKYWPAFSSVGGEEIDVSLGTYIPIYAFLVNGWKIKPQEADHTLAIWDGILLVSGGGDPFEDTTGDYTVRINYQQPVQAITVATGGGSPVDPDEIADAVWDNFDGIEPNITPRQAMRLAIAILAGKTTITVGEDSTAVVKFRDTEDTKDRVVATMTESERTEMVLDAD